jgi:hypothetical protein
VKQRLTPPLTLLVLPERLKPERQFPAARLARLIRATTLLQSDLGLAIDVGCSPHVMAPTSASESATEPNTPPCILIILIA